MKPKKYVVKTKQTNGIETISTFTKKEILERMNWWIRDFTKITIEREENYTKEYKY